MSRWDNMVERTPIDTSAASFLVLASDLGITPDKSKVWVTGSISGTYHLGWIDVATNTFSGSVAIGSASNDAPNQLLIDPVAGAYAYTIKVPGEVVSPFRNGIRKIDLSTGSTTATAFPVGALPSRFEITPDGAYLVYGAARDATGAGGVSNNIWKIRTSDMAVLATLSSASSGPNMIGECAFTSDSATAVAAGVGANVYILDMATFTVGSPISLPASYDKPYQCVMSADDSTCWVAMQHTGTVYDVVVPLDMSGLTWGTPVVLNASTTARNVSFLGPLRFFLSRDETAILFADTTSDDWAAVQISGSTLLKNVSLAESVAVAVGRHGLVKIHDRKFYLLTDTSPDYVLWVESDVMPSVQVMRWW